KLGPKKPMGKKNANRKMKKVVPMAAPWLSLAYLFVMAMHIMHSVIPAPLNRNSFRRPNRSMVKKATNEAANFHVNMPAASTRERSAVKPKLSWKIVVQYVLIAFAPVI